MTDKQMTDKQAAAAQKAAEAVEAILAGWPVCDNPGVPQRDDIGCGQRFEPFGFAVIDLPPSEDSQGSEVRIVKMSVLCQDCTFKYFQVMYGPAE